MTTPSTLAQRDWIAGLERGVSIIEAFDDAHPRMTAAEAGQRTGMTRTAARRYLLTLQHMGYVAGDGKLFWLTPRVLRLGQSYLESARLPRIVQPVLYRLAAQTQLSFSCVVRDGHEVVIVARSALHERGQRLMAHGLHLGSRLPAHATSTGRVLLVALPAAELRQWLASHDLLRLTAHTVTDSAALEGVLDEVRRQDFCLALEEHELAVQALAVPLRNMEGRTVAALNIVTSPQRMAPADMVAELLPLLQEAARELRPLL